MGLRRVPKEEMPDDHAERVERAYELNGDADFLEILANSPELTSFYYEDFYEGVFYDGDVSIRVKELVRLRLAGLHGCMYCQSSDVESAKEHGVTEAEIEAIWRMDDDVFTDAERAALELANVLSNARPDGAVSEDLLTRLQRHYSDAEIVELSVVASILTGMTNMLFAFDMVEREVVCELPGT